MLGGFGHGGLSLFCSDSWAYELDCVFRVSGGVFLSPFPFFSLPESPTLHDTSFLQGTSEHNSYGSIISQSGTSS